MRRFQIDSLYKRGTPGCTFALVLEGSLTIAAGADGFISLATPWMPLSVHDARTLYEHYKHIRAARVIIIISTIRIMNQKDCIHYNSHNLKNKYALRWVKG